MDEKEYLLRTLKDVSCNDQCILEVMELYEKKEWKELILLLKKHRCLLMDSLHEKQKEVDTLDYLIYKMKYIGLH
jgi:hypothetical protein